MIEHLDSLRTEAYKANFFMSKASRADVDADATPLWPTALNEQNLFFKPYKHSFEMTHDLYSVIYKPLVLTLLACQSLFISGVYAAQAIAGCLAFIGNIIPFPVVLDNEEGLEFDTYDALNKAQGAVLTLLVSISMLVVYLPIDTISSILSFVSRSIASICSSAAELLNDDSAPKMSYSR